MDQRTQLIFTTIAYMQERQNQANREIIAEEETERKFNLRFWSRKQSSERASELHSVLLTNAEIKA